MILPFWTMSSRSDCGKLLQHVLDAITRTGALRLDRRVTEYAHAALVEQPIGQPLAGQIRIEQLESSTVSTSERPSTQASSSGRAWGARCRAARRRDRDRPAVRVGRLGQKLQQDAAGAPVSARPVRAGAKLLGDRERHAGGDLLRAGKILVRGPFKVAALERNQALIPAHLGTLIDGHGQMPVAEQAFRVGLLRPQWRLRRARRRTGRRPAPCRER